MKLSNYYIVVFADNDLLYNLLASELQDKTLSILPFSQYALAEHQEKYNLTIVDHPAHILMNDLKIDKPFAAIDIFKAVQNFYNQSRSNHYKLGDYSFTPHLNLIAKGDQLINLTEKETQILSYLLKANKKVTKDELLSEIWGYNNEIETKTLETHIYKMKQKFPLLKTILRHSKADYILEL